MPLTRYFDKRGLPVTGQETPFVDGDDGDIEAGKSPPTRFIDVGNGTVRDLATGLTWVKQPELIIPGSSGQSLVAHGNWETEHPYIVGDMVLGTFEALPQTVSGGAYADGHTEVTVAGGDGFRASDEGRWVTLGEVGTFFICKYTDNLHVDVYGDASATDEDVWVVKTYAVCIEAHTSDGSEFETDHTAGYWADNPFSASAANLTTPQPMCWDAALRECNKLTYCGFSDWRMPNPLEMITLHDWEQSQTNATRFHEPFASTLQDSHYLTSGTRADDTTRCWLDTSSLTTPINAQAIAAKTSALYVLPVRGGRLNG